MSGITSSRASSRNSFRGNRGRQRGTEAVTGFTLIELLVVVAIIGILAVIALPRFQDAIVKCKTARVLGDCNALKTALLRYKMDHKVFPTLEDDQNRHYLSHTGTMDLEVLTTPIQYLAHCNVLDPFADRRQYKGHKGQSRPEVIAYCYTSYDGDRETGQFWMQAIKATEADYHSAFQISAWGPDMTHTGSPWIEVKGYWERKAEWRRIYDPSNGLRSIGDIAVAGGNINFRHYRH